MRRLYQSIPQEKGALKSIQFMESKLNESDVKLSYLSKTVEDVVDRLSKVEHMCLATRGLSLTNITTHPNHYRQNTATASINEEKEIEKRTINVIINNFTIR